MYEYFIFKVKFDTENEEHHKFLVRVDSSLDNRFHIANDICQQLKKACIAAYHTFPGGHMISNCYGVARQFLIKHFKYHQTKPFDDCNFLYNEMAGSNCAEDQNMAQLQQGNYFIGVDAAVRLYRSDDIMTEITIASSNERLLQILKTVNKITSDWIINRTGEVDIVPIKQMINRNINAPLRKSPAIPTQSAPLSNEKNSQSCVIL